ncbi:hypothetical protein D9613_002494 [Agrocybe pediades]|uniref:Nephrocystin 3-like N-terminal domain-containing protein n=1 Tax=Agrocybe pediades TaxID=84607 RepID=A0A8H4QNZ6_9AGAR|nr:hypothetical protein D9613_002494 [Agrocybe pediades]
MDNTIAKPVKQEQSDGGTTTGLSFDQPIMMNTPSVTQHISVPHSRDGQAASFPMMTFNRNAVFNGGTFTQHISQTIQKGSFDVLKDAVAPNAFHNSGADFDPPKCHANTRVAILKRIVDWVHGSDEKTTKYPIMWLNGAAGAGKTAIMHSVIEELGLEGSGVASFFFWRSDPSRNHVKAFIATLAYQMYQSLPEIRPQILSAIDHDHFLFHRSLAHQLNSIIVNPAKSLPLGTRFLVAIDGLDECLDREAQRHVLETLETVIRRDNLPVIFLIASRPELDIRSAFETMPGLFTRLTLDNDYQSFKDIDLYLRNNLAQVKKVHPFRRFLSSTWPEENSVRDLVAKSSGQFIYAATVVKFLKFLRRRPDHSLDMLLNLRASTKDLPFSELDSLYVYIMTSVPNVDQALQAFSYMMLEGEGGGSRYVEEIECILSVERGELEIALCDINAVVNLSAGRLRFLHASFQDFLLDPARSKEFYLDLEEHKQKHLINSFKIFASPGGPPQLTVYNYSSKQLPTCPLTPELLTVVEQFSLPKLSDDSNTKDKAKKLMQQFIPAFFEFVPRLEKATGKNLLENYLDQLDAIILSRISYYYTTLTNRFLDVIWVCFHKTFGKASLRSAHERLDPLAIHEFNFHRPPPFVDGISFDEYLSDLLHDSECAGNKAFCTRLFTLAAYDCLLALCSVDVQEPLDHLSAVATEDESVAWEDLSSDTIVQDDSDSKDDPDPTMRGDSRATTGSDLESFRLLAFILFLLPRSSRYEPLIELCRNPGPCFYHDKRYATVPLSQNHPIRFGKLLREMNRYLERIGVEGGVMREECYREEVEEVGPLCEACERKDRGKTQWRLREF